MRQFGRSLDAFYSCANEALDDVIIDTVMQCIDNATKSLCIRAASDQSKSTVRGEVQLNLMQIKRFDSSILISSGIARTTAFYFKISLCCLRVQPNLPTLDHVRVSKVSSRNSSLLQWRVSIPTGSNWVHSVSTAHWAVHWAGQMKALKSPYTIVCSHALTYGCMPYMSIVIDGSACNQLSVSHKKCSD